MSDFAAILTTCVLLAANCEDTPPVGCTLLDIKCIDVADAIGHSPDPIPYWKVPFSDIELPDVGAKTPFVTYDIDASSLGGSASIVHVPERLASEAINRQAVLLSETGDYAEITARNSANSLLLRFSLAPGLHRDETVSLSVYVNGEDSGDLLLSPNYIHNERGDPVDNTFHPATEETPVENIWRWWSESVLRDVAINPGDIVRLQRDEEDDAPAYYLDLIDLEQVPPPLQIPSGFVSVTDYGATPDDPSDDDLASFWKAIDAAVSGEKQVWIPSGTFHLSGRVTLKDEQQGMTFAGAGMWHSEIFITKTHNETNEAKGVFWIQTSDVTLRDFKMTRVANYRRLPETPDNHGGAAAKGDGDRLTIERVWINHSGTTTWYAGNNAVIRDNRVRNNYADGMHIYSSGSDNVVENNHIRGCGDDGLAHWGNEASGTGNIWRNNTVEAGYFGRGIIAFGTDNEQYIDNLVIDNYGIGMLAATTRVNQPMKDTVFAGNVIIRSADHAIEIRPRDWPLKVRFENNYLIDTMTDAINIRPGNLVEATLIGNVVKWSGDHGQHLQSVIDNSDDGSVIVIE